MSAPDPAAELAAVRDARLSTARRVFKEAVDTKAREMVEQDAGLDEGGRATLDAGLSAVLALGRHDGDCQAFQHTYVADQGEPGIWAHGNGRHRALDVVGENGRRLLVRGDPDGVYLGGVRLNAEIALRLGAEIAAVAQWSAARQKMIEEETHGR